VPTLCLKQDGLSTTYISLESEELEDLQRYLDVITRAEVLFSRGVVFVEGDAAPYLP
jgi:predicted ATP-dependent endonuclease of OLD family